MKYSIIVGAVLFVGCSGPAKTGGDTAGGQKPGTSTERVELSVKEIVTRYKPAVVRVESDRGVGTGFIVSEDGRVATNLHVIAGASAIKVSLADKREFSVDKIIAVDPARDLAVLHVVATDLQTVLLGDSDQAAAGDPIVIIGNPLGVLDFTVSDGLVSSVRQENDLKVIQTSAPISQGSSGGPLFNSFGEVIGIATFFAAEGQNLNFAIPSNYLRPMVVATGGESVAEFAVRFRRAARVPLQPIRPTIPVHELSVLKGCSDRQLGAVQDAINMAIEVGAPVYNRGEHEACFVIYRSAAEAFETDKAVCSGVRKALRVGLDRAAKESDFTKKAWAMRDAFDGLLIVIAKQARGAN